MNARSALMPIDVSQSQERLVAPWAEEQRHAARTGPRANTMVNGERQRDRATAHGHALARRRERTGAHQPAGADDQRLVQHHDAPEERGASEPVPVQDAVERLLGAEDLAVGPTHGDADGVTAAHQDALHERLTAVCEACHGQASPGR